MTIIKNKKAEKVIRTAINSNIPTLLMGETGTGKTTEIKELAKTEGKQLVRLNLNGQTGREELLGKYMLYNGATIWQDGPLLTAIRNGYWILLDEVNAALPEVLLTLQALAESNEGKLGEIMLAEKDGEIIIPHSDTRLFATCNPSDYLGTKDFNMATLSRFVVIYFDGFTKQEEKKIIMEKTGISAVSANRLLEVTYGLRKLRDDDKISMYVSLRELIQASELIKSGCSIDAAVNVSIVNKCQNKYEKDTVLKEVAKHMKVTDASLKIKEATMKSLETENKELKAKMAKIDEQKAQVEKDLKKMTGFVQSFKDIDASLKKYNVQ